MRSHEQDFRKVIRSCACGKAHNQACSKLAVASSCLCNAKGSGEAGKGLHDDERVRATSCAACLDQADYEKVTHQNKVTKAAMSKDVEYKTAEAPMGPCVASPQLPTHRPISLSCSVLHFGDSCGPSGCDLPRGRRLATRIAPSYARPPDMCESRRIFVMLVLFLHACRSAILWPTRSQASGGGGQRASQHMELLPGSWHCREHRCASWTPWADADFVGTH